MPQFAHAVRSHAYRFCDPHDLPNKAKPLRSGDMLAVSIFCNQLHRMQIFEGDGAAQLGSALPEAFAQALWAMN